MTAGLKICPVGVQNYQTRGASNVESMIQHIGIVMELVWFAVMEFSDGIFAKYIFRGCTVVTRELHRYLTCPMVPNMKKMTGKS